MTKTIVGLFDKANEAKRAMEELRNSNFARDNIAMTNGASDAATMRLLQSGGIATQDVQFYTEGVQRGGTLVVVRSNDNQAQRAADILAKYETVDIDTRSAELKQSGVDMPVSTLNEDGTVFQVMEEQLAVGKRQVQRGGVRVHSVVTETPVEQQVQLREETVNVTRHAVDRPVTDADMATLKNASFEVTSTGEEAVVSKTAHVVEEVVVGKQTTEHTETVRDTVRRTNVDVEQISGTQHTSAPGFDALEADFRTHYTTNDAQSGGNYDQYRTVYRYGYDLGTDERTSKGDWSTVEANARRTWEQRNPGTWDRFKASIHYAWDKARGQR